MQVGRVFFVVLDQKCGRHRAGRCHYSRPAVRSRYDLGTLLEPSVRSNMVTAGEFDPFGWRASLWGSETTVRYSVSSTTSMSAIPSLVAAGDRGAISDALGVTGSLPQARSSLSAAAPAGAAAGRCTDIPALSAKQFTASSQGCGCELGSSWQGGMRNASCLDAHKSLSDCHEGRGAVERLACEVKPLSRYHASSDAVSLQWASSLDGSRASSLDGSRASTLGESRASTLGESRASTLGESRASTLDDNRASHLPYVTGTPLAPSPITTAIPRWLAADIQLKVQAGLLARARRGAARKLQAAARGAAVRKQMPSLLLSARKQSMHLARRGECAGGARALDASLGDSVGGSVDGPMDSQVRSSPGSLVMDPMRMTLADSERAMHGSPMVAMPPVALTGAASFAPGGSELAGVLQSTIGASCLLVDWGGQRHQLSSVARALRTRGAGAGGDYNELQTDGILLIPKAIPEDLCEQLLRKADTLKWHELWALKETQEDEKRRTFTLGHSKLKSACLELGSDIMSTHADYEDCPVFKPTMILGQHGAGDQSLHCDTDVTDTYSMLFAITNRVFHWRPSPDVPLRIVRMKRRDVLLFKANHCHGAGGVREQFTVLSIPGGGTVGLHMYGGRGILPDICVKHLRAARIPSRHYSWIILAHRLVKGHC
jgi:hypothetical protein